MREKKRAGPPTVYRLAYFFLDNILARLSFIAIPFWLTTRTIRVVVNIFWILSNEFSKSLFGRCGNGVRIYGQFHITSPKKLYVGNNVHINSNALLRCEGRLYIDDNVHISRNVVIYTINHNYAGECLPYDEGKILKPVHIGKNVWIGINVVITPGVRIGEGAIVGMGTVVARNIPPLSIVGSPPQRILKNRDQSHYEKLDDEHRYGGMSGFRWKQ